MTSPPGEATGSGAGPSGADRLGPNSAEARDHVVDGLAVHERVRPGAVRVVLVHGAMDRGASFGKAWRRLDDLHLVRYDRRGYGRSAGAGVAPDVTAHVDDLLAVVGEEPAVVVGHSFGGLVALAAGERRADLVRAVGAFEAPMPWAPWWPVGVVPAAPPPGAPAEDPAEVAERFMRRVIGDEHWARLPPSTRAARRAEGPALLAELRAARSGTAPYDTSALRRLGVPVVVGFGAVTDERHRRSALTLAAALGGADVVVVAGARHGAHTSHADGFAAFVRRTVRAAAARCT